MSYEVDRPTSIVFVRGPFWYCRVERGKGFVVFVRFVRNVLGVLLLYSGRAVWHPPKSFKVDRPTR